MKEKDRDNSQAVKAPSAWRENFSNIVGTAILALFFTTFTAQAFEIPTESMETTLLVGDRPFVNKISFAPRTKWLGPLMPYEEIQRGDIIIFLHPGEPSRIHLVKRAIGLPGDRLKLIGRRVYINGHPLDEGYAVHEPWPIDEYRDNFPGRLGATPDTPYKAWRNELPGHIDKDGWLVIPPDSYFAMGDNREHSNDSRYWGFVPRANILGRPLGLVWSIDFERELYQQSVWARAWTFAKDFRNMTRWNRIFLTFPRQDP